MKRLNKEGGMRLLYSYTMSTVQPCGTGKYAVGMVREWLLSCLTTPGFKLTGPDAAWPDVVDAVANLVTEQEEEEGDEPTEEARHSAEDRNQPPSSERAAADRRGALAPPGAEADAESESDAESGLSLIHI